MPSITPEQIGQFIAHNLTLIVDILVLVILTWLLLWLIRSFASRLRKRMRNSEIDPERLARLVTVENVVVASLRALVLAVAVFTFLGMLGFNLAPLLASAGVAGLAVSLGAQSLIKDFIGGFLIVLENQFGVGDVVAIGSITGTVEAITLRTVSVREYSGRLNIIPNGEIRIVSNLSRNWARPMVDLYVAYDADVGEVVKALEDAMQAAAQDAGIRDFLIEPPQVSGWNSLDDRGVQIRLSARVQAGKQYLVESVFRRYALQGLRQRRVHLALPAQDIYLQPAGGKDFPTALDQRDAGPASDA